MTRRTEYWWIQWDEREGSLPLEPARIGFDGERPMTIEEIGLDIERDFATCGARLIERVLPAGRAAAAVEKLTEPQDAFGAHITEGTLGPIGDREIGPGHVVLSEARYRWLFERAGLPVENFPSASA